MNRFNKFINNTSVSIVLVVMLVLAAATLVWNSGFHFTFYNQELVISIESEQINDVLNSVSFDFDSGVARVDRELGEISLQKTEFTEALRFAERLEEDERVTNTVITERIQVTDPAISQRASIAIVGAALASLIFVYAVAIRKLKGKEQQVAYATVLFLSLGLYTGLFIYVGLTSLVSRVYVLTEVSFNTIVVTAIWGLIVVFVPIVNVTMATTVRNTLARIDKFRKSAIGFGFTIWLFMIVGLMIGLGVNFLIEGILWSVGLLLVSISVFVLPTFYYRLFTGSIFASLTAESAQTKSNEDVEEAEVVEKVGKTTSKVQKPNKTATKTKKPGKAKRRNRR